MARIVIADDDKLAQKIYKNILEYLGHEYVLCENGKEAVIAVKQASTDLVILDYMMPEMDGYQACRAIRQLPNGINIPIIIVSANDSQEEILNCLNVGANDYLLKPIKEAILVAKLKNFLKTASLHKNELDMVRSKATIADRFKIQKVLGYGAHSVVFLSEDIKNNNEKVAVKLFNQSVVSDEIIQSFVETAGKLQKAAPENVIQIIDYGQYNGHIYAVLEYADEGDLATLLKHKESLSEKEIVKLGFDISKALLSQNQHGLLHLDIKPENILISKGTFKLTDFGIIKQQDTATIAINSEIWSTASFSPPETFIDQDKISIKSDIYSLGVTLYLALTGDNPFMAEKPSVSMYRQVNLQPTSLLDMDGKYSVEVAVLLDMMLSKNPEQRPSPEVLNTTFSFLSKCFENDDKKLLTYLEKSAPSLEQKNPEDELQKTNDLTQAVAKLKEATKLQVHLYGAKVPVSSRSMITIAPNAKFVQLAIAILAFIFIYYSSQMVMSLFREKIPEYDFKGIPTMVMCEKCGFIEEQPVIDIMDSRCSKCRGQNWQAMHCFQCNKDFPFNEDKYNDSNINNPDQLDNIYRCPFCKSKKIDQIVGKGVKER